MPASDEPLRLPQLTGQDRPVLRVSGPAEIVQVIPYLLGFHPERSVVMVALRAKAIVVSARYDLAAPPESAEGLCRSAADAGAERVLVAIYDDDFAGHPLDHRDYLGSLRVLFARHDLRVVDALAVGSGHWWSYLCTDDECCPAEGTPLDPAGVAAAGAVVEGLVALPRRADLEAELAPDPERMARVLAALLDLGKVEDDRPEVVLRAEDWTVVRRFVARARRGAGPPDAREAARVLWALMDVAVRDATVGYLASRPEPQVAEAWRDLVTVAPSPWRSPVATVYALWCFATGSGARCNLAVDVALEANPSYSMARLLAEAQVGGVNPFEFLAAVAGECQLVGRRIQRKRHPLGRRRAAWKGR